MVYTIVALTPVMAFISDGQTEYELFAVMHHEGGLHSGHYTAHVRHCLSNVWLSCTGKSTRHIIYPYTHKH
jgi:ubiquitin C-terminal hydrolase